MTFIKIDDALYPAAVSGRLADEDWDGRASKAITLEMSHAEAAEIFTDGLSWSIVQQEEVAVRDESGMQVGTEIRDVEYDNCEYALAGDLTDHRDGTITVKMGKLTDLEEAYEIMLGGVE